MITDLIKNIQKGNNEKKNLKLGIETMKEPQIIFNYIVFM